MMNPGAFIDLSIFPEMRGRNPLFGEKTYLDPTDHRSFFATGDLQLNEENLGWARTQRLAGHLLDRNAQWGTNPYGDNHLSVESIVSFHANEFPTAGNRMTSEMRGVLNRLNEPITNRTQTQQQQAQANSTQRYHDPNFIPRSSEDVLNRAKVTGNENYLVSNPLFLTYLTENFDRIDDRSDSIWNDGELEKKDIVQTMNEFYGANSLSRRGFNAEVKDNIAHRFIEENAYNVDNVFSDKGNVMLDDIQVASARANAGVNRLTIDHPKFLSFLEDQFSRYSGSSNSIDREEMLEAILEWNGAYGRHHGFIAENTEAFRETFKRITSLGNAFSNIDQSDIARALEGKRGTTGANYSIPAQRVS